MDSCLTALESLCRALDLGAPVQPPRPVSGGLMHRMYFVRTSRRRYAVKALNPQIMLRPEARRNMIRSEAIAARAAERIPAAAAIRFHRSALQKTDGRYFLFYDWIDGKSLVPAEIAPAHCEKIAAVLARLHQMDFPGLDAVPPDRPDRDPADWNGYLRRGEECGAPWEKYEDPLPDQTVFGQLDWLEYNLKRSLGIDCADEAERKLGTEQVTGTLTAIETRLSRFPAIRNCLAAVSGIPLRHPS